MSRLHLIKAAELKKILEENPEAQVIDVRESAEHESESLKPSRNVPLSTLEKTLHEIDRSKPVYLLCRSGNRATQAAHKLEAQGFETVCVIEGGIEACKTQGLSVEKGLSTVWAMDRQVRFTAGSLMLAGILLAWKIHPAFIALSIFVSAGLIYSAVTDTCGMAMMLAKMPWNRRGCAAKKG